MTEKLPVPYLRGQNLFRSTRLCRGGLSPAPLRALPMGQSIAPLAPADWRRGRPDWGERHRMARPGRTQIGSQGNPALNTRKASHSKTGDFAKINAVLS